MLFPTSPSCFLERHLSEQVGLRTMVLRKSEWEVEKAITDEERDCIMSELWGVGVEFLSGTCYSEDGDSDGNCCAEIQVVTWSFSVSICHRADFSVIHIRECPR